MFASRIFSATPKKFLYYPLVSSKNKLRFLVKLSTENSYFQVIIFYLDELQLPVKISQEINEGINCSQISFLQKCVQIFLIQFICRKILIYVIHRIFRFWQVTKAKRWKTENPFVDNVFNYDLAKFQKTEATWR